MKTKFFLLVSLVLLAVQGWAAPPDSLLIRASGLIPYPDPNGLHPVAEDQITGPEGIMQNTVGTTDFDPTQLKPVVRNWCEAYDISTWYGDSTQYMGFSFGCVDRMNIKVLLGEETDFYLRAFQGNLFSPITIEMTEGQDVFDFPKTSIYPSELTELDSTMANFPEWPWSKWCGKTMRIGFHPTSVGTYTAKFKVSGQTSKKGIVDKVIEMKVIVVDDLDERSIYINPSTIDPFECNVGGSDTKHFTIKAKNISGPLTVYLDDDCDVWWDYFDSKIPLPHVNLKQTGGRFSFRIEGSDVVQPDPYNNIYYEQSIISAEDAAQGATLTITYNPAILGGNHNAKAVITGDGVTAQIHLRGHAPTSSVTVSKNKLTFPDYNIDYSDPLSSIWTQEFTVTGSNLLGPLVLNLTDDDGNAIDKDMFSYSIAFIGGDVIDVSEAERGAKVQVRYNPTEPGVHKAKITISEGYSVRAVVHLIGTSEVDLPVVTATPPSLSFPNATVGETTQPITLMVWGNNLTSDLVLTPPETTGANGYFTINRERISADEANEAYQAGHGIPVLVTFTPTETGTTNGRIIISGGGASSVTVPLSGTGVPSLPTVNPEELTFNDVVVGDYKTDHFTVWGDFTSNLELTVTPANGVFSINKDVITPEQAASGQTITVTYTPIAEGTQTATVTIRGGGAPGTKTVRLTGNAVVREIKAEPAALTFSKQTVGVPISQPFTVTATNPNAPLTLKLNDDTGMFSFAGSTSNTMTISADEAANGAEVSVTYKPTSAGSHIASITITGGGALDEKIVSLIGSAVNREITARPDSWDFGNVPLNLSVPRSKNIIIQADNLTGDLAMELTERPVLPVKNYSISKTVITAAEAANGATVTVYYTPTAVGPHNASIKISGGGAPTKYVSITGAGVVPSIATSESSLNFGNVLKNDSKPLTFVVTGTDLTSNLTLSSNNSYFTVTPSSISKEDAALGVLVTVTYKPTATDNHSGTITISSEGASASVNVSGRCVVPTINVSKTILDFGNMDAGTSKSLTFTVTGTDLTEGISLLVASTDSHADFSITPTSLGSNANGAAVKVTCTANVAGSISGRVTISSKDAVSKTVDLTGSVKCHITTSKPGLNFSPGKTKLTFTVTCVGANDKLTLNKIGDDPSYFTVTPSTIYKTEAQDGKTVTVECIPKTRERLSAKIKITGGGADDPKYVTLSYSDGSVSINLDDPEGEGDGGEDVFTNGSQDAYGDPITNVYELQMGAKVYAKDLNIIIESPIEQSAVISDIAGHAWNVDLKKGLNEIPVNASGIYLIRIREKTTKLLLK